MQIYPTSVIKRPPLTKYTCSYVLIDLREASVTCHVRLFFVNLSGCAD